MSADEYRLGTRHTPNASRKRRGLRGQAPRGRLLTPVAHCQRQSVPARNSGTALLGTPRKAGSLYQPRCWHLPRHRYGRARSGSRQSSSGTIGREPRDVRHEVQQFAHLTFVQHRVHEKQPALRLSGPPAPRTMPLDVRSSITAVPSPSSSHGCRAWSQALRQLRVGSGMDKCDRCKPKVTFVTT